MRLIAIDLLLSIEVVPVNVYTLRRRLPVRETSTAVMNRVAAITDIHANLTALDAALAASHVMTLAHRRTRCRLLADSCDALATARSGQTAGR
jgi:hypothetical protein